MRDKIRKTAIQDLEGKTVLITGGSGFLGQKMAEAVTEKGAIAVILDQRAPDREYPWFHMDITNKVLLSCHGTENDVNCRGMEESDELDTSRLVMRDQTPRNKLDKHINSYAPLMKEGNPFTPDYPVPPDSQGSSYSSLEIHRAIAPARTLSWMEG